MPEYAPQRSPQLPGTSHMSIVDDSGEVVAMTTTVEFVFGSEMMAKGFFLNNQLTDFSFEPRAGRQAGGQCAGAGQAAAVRHVADHRVRQGRQFPSVGRLARRARHHRLCHPVPVPCWTAGLTPSEAIALPRAAQHERQHHAGDDRRP